MTVTVAGYFKPDGELSKKLPYTNANGFYYSEMEGRFTPHVRSDVSVPDVLIVRGLFVPKTYNRGMRDGFHVIIEPTKRQKKGKLVFDAQYRTRAFRTVGNEALRKALMETVAGVGETYSDRLIDAFNENETFFEALRDHLEGNEFVENVEVPASLINATLQCQENIEKAVTRYETQQSQFYNTLNQFGLVSYRSATSYPFQRTVNEWWLIFNQLRTYANSEILTEYQDLVDTYGPHATYLMTHPNIFIAMEGDPMVQSPHRLDRTIEATKGIMEMTSNVVDESTYEDLGLGDNSLFSYSLELMHVLKEHKDGGFNNPHSGDTVFVFTQDMHDEVVEAGNFTLSMDEVIQTFTGETKRYPVVIFERDDVHYIQFYSAYKRNDGITRQLADRMTEGNVPFALPEDYEHALDEVLENEGDGVFYPAKEQKEALQGLNRHSFSVLTGGPGTGKTTLLKYFLRVLTKVDNKLFDQQSHRIVFCAPTGKAAKRMRESLDDEDLTSDYEAVKNIQRQTYTIHSFIGNNYAEIRNEAEQDDVGSRWLIIDEASMLDEQLLSELLYKVPLSYRLVFIGDDAQLPSIGPGAVLRDLKQLSEAGQFHLNEPFRSEGSLTDNAYTIRDRVERGETIYANDLVYDDAFSILDYSQLTEIHKNELIHDKDYLAMMQRNIPDLHSTYGYSGWVASFLYHQQLKERMDVDNSLILMPFSKKGTKKRLAVTPFNQVVQSIVRPFRRNLPALLREKSYGTILDILGDDKGKMSLYHVNADVTQRKGVNEAVSVNRSVLFRVGDRVVSTRNKYMNLALDDERMRMGDYTIGNLTQMWFGRMQENDLLISHNDAVMNGDTGIVKAITRDGGMFVQFDTPDEQTDRALNPWVYYNRKDADMNGDALALAYSMTVHKSQGSEADTVVVCLPDASDTTILSYRELIYTAITRAKKKVVILGSKKVLEEALNRTQGNRHTRLRDDFQNIYETV